MAVAPSRGHLRGKPALGVEMKGFQEGMSRNGRLRFCRKLSVTEPYKEWMVY